MKRLIIGICVLSCLLALGITVSAVFHIAHTPTAYLLQDASQAALDGNWEDALQCSQAAQARWKRFHHLTACFADHSPMDEIDSLFAQLELYSQEQNRADFPARCAALSQLTKAIADSHSFRWWTFL